MIWLWYNLIYDIWYMIYDIWYVSTMKLKLYSIFTNIRCSPWVQRPSVAGSAACQLMAWVKKQRKVSTIQSNYLKKTETTKLTSNFCTCTYPNPPFLCSNSHLPPLPKLLPPNKIDTISNKNSPPFPSSPWYTFSLRFSGCRRDWLRRGGGWTVDGRWHGLPVLRGVPEPPQRRGGRGHQVPEAGMRNWEILLGGVERGNDFELVHL